jgi:hypothetical protein
VTKPRACARCDWTSDDTLPVEPRLQAIEHAALGHPLCTVCLRSLDLSEPIVCERCLTRAQRHLQQIVELYALLPEELDHPSAHAALVLLGPGSEGVAFRDMTKSEWRSLAGAAQHPLGLPGREHAVDNKEDDGVSVVFALTSWETDWREHFDEATPTPAATLAGAAGYLERRMRPAANGDATRDPHPAFADFATELAGLLVAIEEAGSRGDRPRRAPVACFGCGRSKTLAREYRPADPCEHVRPTFPPPANSKKPSLDQPERLERHRAALALWQEAHARCDQGGLVARWTCRVCDRVYDDAEYMLALSDSMRVVSESRGWGTVWEVATSLGLPPRTVRAWVTRGQVQSMRADETERVLVWWPDARELAAAREARLAAAAARRAEAAARRSQDAS